MSDFATCAMNFWVLPTLPYILEGNWTDMEIKEIDSCFPDFGPTRSFNVFVFFKTEKGFSYKRLTWETTSLPFETVEAMTEDIQGRR